MSSATGPLRLQRFPPQQSLVRSHMSPVFLQVPESFPARLMKGVPPISAPPVEGAPPVFGAPPAPDPSLELWPHAESADSARPIHMPASGAEFMGRMAMKCTSVRRGNDGAVVAE